MSQPRSGVSTGTSPTGSPAVGNWSRLTVEEAVDLLDTSAERGLSDAEAQRRLERYGPNEVTEKGVRGRWQILLAQFAGVMTWVLFAAAGISVLLGDLVDAGVILAIIVLNASMGFVQEYRAEQSIAALKRMSSPTVRVRREGQVREIPAREVVPGDVLLLETGNIVPADGRLITSTNLRTQEAALTGESEAVEKDASRVFQEDRALGDQKNMVFSGTIVTYGHGEALVTATGMATELGKIAGMLQSVEQEHTPLQRRLDRLGKVLAAAALGLVIVVFLLGLARGEAWQEMLLVSVSLAVAVIPEALTAVVTVALSLGAQRMLKRRALIRRLLAVETLGSVSVICTDKTGTLTQNRMTVTVLDVANHRAEFVQRNGQPGLRLQPVHPESSEAARPTINLLLTCGALCNDAVLKPDEAGNGAFHAIGDPTEGALVVAAAYEGILQDELRTAFPRVAELPFDSHRKLMTTVHAIPRPDEIPEPLRDTLPSVEVMPPYLAATKGAMDSMMRIAGSVWVEGRREPMNDEWRRRIQAAHDGLAGKGMRVLAVGIRPLDDIPQADKLEELERDITLVGLVGMIDPPRVEVPGAVKECKAAGVRPVMITGDHPLTALHIAREIGIAENERYITGQELESIPDEDLRELTKEVSVFARVSPEHKIRLVTAYQADRSVVAMTGDGVNDAPALKKADIGVAMGITGTDVSKEASAMVLLDDNFATIVAAIREGRIVYDNIRRFIRYLLTANASEVAVMLFGPFLGLPIPLLPLQILWINLVTDGPPALALGVEPGERDVMRRPPVDPSHSIFGQGMVPFIFVIGLVTSIVSLGVGWVAFRDGVEHWQTLLFTTMVFSQTALALSVRSERTPLWRVGLFSNRAMVLAVLVTICLQLAVVYIPFFQGLFDTQPLPLPDLALAAGLGLLVMVAAEAWKLGRNRIVRSQNHGA